MLDATVEMSLTLETIDNIFRSVGQQSLGIEQPYFLFPSFSASAYSTQQEKQLPLVMPPIIR